MKNVVIVQFIYLFFLKNLILFINRGWILLPLQIIHPYIYCLNTLNHSDFMALIRYPDSAEIFFLVPAKEDKFLNNTCAIRKVMNPLVSCSTSFSLFFWFFCFFGGGALNVNESLSTRYSDIQILWSHKNIIYVEIKIKTNQFPWTWRLIDVTYIYP